MQFVESSRNLRTIQEYKNSRLLIHLPLAKLTLYLFQRWMLISERMVACSAWFCDVNLFGVSYLIAQRINLALYVTQRARSANTNDNRLSHQGKICWQIWPNRRMRGRLDGLGVDCRCRYSLCNRYIISYPLNNMRGPRAPNGKLDRYFDISSASY